MLVEGVFYGLSCEWRYFNGVNWKKREKRFLLCFFGKLYDIGMGWLTWVYGVVRVLCMSLSGFGGWVVFGIV